MNEELKIIIKAVTSDAKKSIQDIKKELNGVSTEAKSTSSGFSAAMKGIGKSAAIAIGAVVAVGTALVALGKNSLELQKTQAKLNTAFQSAGSTAKQAADTYKGLFRFLGEEDTSVEAAGHLAKLTTNQKDLAEWTKACQGIYATFGDSLPIEGLTEAANESARVGKVTGTLADALNWAGESEDSFNAKLAKTNSFEEREALIRSTLNGLYGNAAEIYEKNNKAILDHNESQARLNASMASAGAAITPLLTALNNLGAAIFSALKPALEVIIPAIATFVNWIAKGVEAVLSLFGAVTGGSSSINTFSNMGAGIANASTGADNLTGGLNDAAAAAEKVKRATMGFDELNVLSSNSSSGSSGGSGGSGGGPGYTSSSGGSNFTMDVEQSENSANGLLSVMKNFASELKDVFAPSIAAWSSAFDTIKESWNNAKADFVDGATSIKNALVAVTSYILTDFIPSIVNSFSVNIAPVVGDILGFAIEELGKDFKFVGEIIENLTNTIIIPALDVVKNVFTGTFDAIGSAWAAKGQPLLDALSETFEHIRGVLKALYDEAIQPILAKLISTLDDVWKTGLQPALEKAIELILHFGTELLNVYNKTLAPVVEWLASKILPSVRETTNTTIEVVGELFKGLSKHLGNIMEALSGVITFISGVFTGDWKKAWDGIKTSFKNIWEAIVDIVSAAWSAIKKALKLSTVKDYFEDIWKGIKGAFSNVSSWFSDRFSNAWSNIKKKFKTSTIKDYFKSVWNNIKGVFGSVSSWFSNTFSKAWSKVKNVFSSGGKVFNGIKDGILKGLKSVINALITGINKVIAVPFNGLNSALKRIKSISILGMKPFNWISTISIPQIPKLARGGIVDQATLAMIGERGKEAVVPLENNTEWMDKLVDRLSARNSAPSKIVLMLDSRELGWANINSINDITRQTGALQLTLV